MKLIQRIVGTLLLLIILSGVAGVIFPSYQPQKQTATTEASIVLVLITNIQCWMDPECNEEVENPENKPS